MTLRNRTSFGPPNLLDERRVALIMSVCVAVCQEVLRTMDRDPSVGASGLKPTWLSGDVKQRSGLRSGERLRADVSYGVNDTAEAPNDVHPVQSDARVQRETPRL